MKNIAKLIKLTLLVVTTSIMFSCTDDETGTTQSNTISAIASRTSDFSILVSALDRAGLVQTLDQTGPYTVFAPDNAAFSAFLTANNFNSLEEVPIPLLTEILKNHVVSGTNLSTGLTTGYVKTLAVGSASSTNTLSMYINTTNGVRLNGVSNVTQADIVASNGVIHKVNAVIGLPTVVTHAAANGNFSTLAGLLDAQGLLPTLSSTSGTPTPFTVFAPLNSAFTQPVIDLYGTLTDAQKTGLLTYHVVGEANVLSTGIPTTAINTLQGGTFTVAGTVITDAINAQTNIVLTDVQCSNGVIHAIDRVIRPF
ncbi:fasciclin domain-containing protein [Flavobacterium sp.]|uniref:fasciclin domain-containing protein n=1 Tax=Flavobacterium sp. TaxID=239 RepID=UPI003F69A55A